MSRVIQMTTKKYFLSFHTIFILRENIQWLEEFIIYYKNLGFEHFYLYDNTGSLGYAGSSPNKNKYGYPIQEHAEEQFAKIMETYGDCITYYKWQPRDTPDGPIVYAQIAGMVDVINRFGHETEWMAFMDLDEFLISPSNVHIVNYFRTLPESVSGVAVCQKKFVDRHEVVGQYITQDYRCVDHLSIGVDVGVKYIVRSNKVHQIHHQHGPIDYYSGSTRFEHRDILRFNHYNANHKSLDEFEDLYKFKLALDTEDDSMKRYAFLFSEKKPKRKLCILAQFLPNQEIVFRILADNLKDTYTTNFHNSYCFYYETLKVDLNECDIFILDASHYFITKWDNFPPFEHKTIIIGHDTNKLSFLNKDVAESIVAKTLTNCIAETPFI